MKIYISLLLFICCTTSMHAQRLHGTVTDATSKEPIVGVNVYLKSIQKGVTTKKDGVFYFEQANGLNPQDTILFNMVGYNTLKLTVEQFKELDQKAVLKELNLKELSPGRSVRIITLDKDNSK